MRIECLHGYFKFTEERAGEVSQLMSYYGLTLVALHDYYTFQPLLEAPDYSLKGAPLLGQVASVNFEGSPWEVMEQNGLVLDVVTGQVVPITSVTSTFRMSQAGSYYFIDGLLNPGSIDSKGNRVKSYRGWVSTRTWRYKYSEVEYV